jgi:hypothetical protein
MTEYIGTQQQQHNLNEFTYCSPITMINQDVRRRNVAAAASFHSAFGIIGSTTTTNTNTTYNTDPWDEIDSLSTATSDTLHYPNESLSVLLQQHQQQLLQQQHPSQQIVRAGAEFCQCKFITRQRRLSSTGGGRWNMKSPTPNLSGVSSPTTTTTSPSKVTSSLPSDDPKQQQQSTSTDLCTRCGKKNSSINHGSFAWSTSEYYKRRSNSFSYLHNSELTMGGSGSSSSSHNTYNISDEPHHANALLFATPQLRFISPASTDMQGGGKIQSNNIFIAVLQAAVERTNIGSSSGGGITMNNHTSTTTTSESIMGGNNNSTGNMIGGQQDEYHRTILRDRSNQLAAAELASLLWVLAHEMSLEDYGVVESQVFTAVFALVHSTDKERRMAGLAAIDALLAAPSADEERKAIKFANTLSNGLRSAHGDFEFLSAVCKALGHMVTRTANVDFVESEVTRALEWLRTDRSDRRYIQFLYMQY